MISLLDVWQLLTSMLFSPFEPLRLRAPNATKATSRRTSQDTFATRTTPRGMVACSLPWSTSTFGDLSPWRAKRACGGAVGGGLAGWSSRWGDWEIPRRSGRRAMVASCGSSVQERSESRCGVCRWARSGRRVVGGCK